MEAMKSILKNVWKISSRLVIKVIGDKVYVFQFEDVVEKDRVLIRQPWSFNKSSIVLKDFNGMSSLEDVNMDRCQLWVQIHGLPLGLMNEKIGIVLGEAIGEVIEVDTTYDHLA